LPETAAQVQTSTGPIAVDLSNRLAERVKVLPSPSAPSTPAPAKMEQNSSRRDLDDGSLLSECISVPQQLMPVTATERRRRESIDYDRFDFDPGHIYLARNNSYRDGLYKMGLTSNLDHRERMLNESRLSASDIGQVRILASVAVPKMGLAEKTLFSVCAGRRVASGVEYFYGSEATFRTALEVVAEDARGFPDAIAGFLLNEPFESEAPMPSSGFDAESGARVTLLGNPAAYVLRNPWHAPGVYRYAVTSRDGWSFEQSLLRKQREGNGVFGFYRVVAALPVADVPAARRALSREARSLAVAEQPSFLRAGLADIEDVFRRALEGNWVAQPTRRGLWVETASRSSRGSQGPKLACPWCGSPLRLRGGAVGDEGIVICPGCGEPLLGRLRHGGGWLSKTY